MTKLEDAISRKKSIDMDIQQYIMEDNYDLANRLNDDSAKVATLISTVCSILVDIRDELQARAKDSVWLESEYKPEPPGNMYAEDAALESLVLLEQIGLNMYCVAGKVEENDSPQLLGEKIFNLIDEIRIAAKAA